MPIYSFYLLCQNLNGTHVNENTGVTLEDPHTEDLSQEVRGFIFSKILVFDCLHFFHVL